MYTIMQRIDLDIFIKPLAVKLECSRTMSITNRLLHIILCIRQPAANKETRNHVLKHIYFIIQATRA